MNTCVDSLQHGNLGYIDDNQVSYRKPTTKLIKADTKLDSFLQTLPYTLYIYVYRFRETK